MKQATFFASTLALASAAVATPALAPRASSSLPPIHVEGNVFLDSNGNRFYIRGIDYQPGGASDPIDPIADSNTCMRDIPYFQKLGINTVRVYTIDNSVNHDQCMDALAQAGIYLALDVNSAKYSLNRLDPGPSYNDVYLQNVFATVDAFQGYSNTLLFFSGNEVINDATNTNAAPYVKAVTRDMRQYIGERGYRKIPVGYSAADVEQNRVQMANYMNCGTPDQRSDFFSFNDYEWCGTSGFQESGYAQAVQEFSNYSIPLFMSEYGCNKVTPRLFDEVQAIYSSEMTGVYSGALAYEYTEESDNPNFGLVSVDGSSVSTMTDFVNLQSQLAQATPPAGMGGGRTESQDASPCPTQDSNWNVPNDELPAIPAPAMKYMTEGAGAGVGLNGPGSQDAGTQSTGVATPGSGAVSNSPSASGSTSTGAAGVLRPAAFEIGPIVCSGVVVMSTLLGAFLL